MNLVILGPAGSGKGTQAAKLAERFDLIHVDMGKLLRQAAKLPTDFGKKIHEIINVKKELVPSYIAKEVLHLKLGSVSRKQGVVFDGFPRNLDQMEYMKEALLEFGRKISQVFFIDISEKESIKRISKRVVCNRCKAGFILGRDIEKVDEKCPKCGSSLSQRIDDTKDGVEKRFRIFKKETAPILDEYGKEGILIEIDGEGSIDLVFESVLENLEKI